jgi:hypothetical protein
MKYQQPYGISDPNAPYINGNPSTGTMGSIPPAASIEHPQREIVKMITASGITPAEGTLDQLALAIQRGKVQFAADAGTPNALVIVLDPVPTALVAGMRVWFKRTLANTGPTTLAVNGVIKDLKRNNGDASAPGDLFAGGIFGAAYDGVQWLIVAGLQFETTISNEFLGGVAFPAEVRHTNPGAFNWIVPTGVYVAEIHLYGGGGGGGTGHANYVGGGGGAAGGYSRKKIAVVPGTVMPLTVGQGGVGGGPAGTTTAGGNGTLSTMASFSATGGAGGAAGINPIPGEPAVYSGYGSGGDVNLSGSYGSSGASGTNTTGGYTGYGGLGGACAGPEGGKGGFMSTGTSGHGVGLGAGGSGGGSAAGINSPGGNGANGAVLIRFVQPAA